MANDRLHIVVFPWLAFGHILPFLELSKSLAKRGHLISFLSTPRNIQRMPKIPLNLTPNLNLVKLPLPRVDGLPEGAEATTDLSPDSVQHLKAAFDGLEHLVARFLDEASPRPDWVICDFVPHWMQGVASRTRIPFAYFSVFPASSFAFFEPPSEEAGGSSLEIAPEELTVQAKWIPFPTTVAYRLYEARQIMEVYDKNSSGVSDAHRLALIVEGCQAIAFRSCPELDSDWLAILQKLYQKDIIPVGLLPPSVTEAGDEGEEITASHGLKIFEWLGKQTPRSVLYIALGSEATLSPELMHTLALGLELSKLPFLWALRKPTYSPDDVQMLPEGFEIRTKDRGVIAKSWVPQLKILSHESVGGFLTHSGWSSVIESLQFGHPLILLPVFGDQGLNARIMAERGFGLEVPRDEEDGSFTREEVADTVRLVMVEEGGGPIRAKAKEMIEIFGNAASQDRYVDGFIQYLKDFRGKIKF